MRKLYKRMVREICTNLGQFLSITLIIAIGAMLMSGMFSAITAMDKSTRKYYDEQNMADLWLYYKGIDSNDAARLIQESGSEEAQPRYTVNETLTVNGIDCILRMHSLTDLNRPLLIQGSFPRSINEIIIDTKFAQANQLSPGSNLQIDNTTLTITGLFMDPEYAYKQKDGASTSVNSNRTFGVAYAQDDTLLERINATDFNKKMDVAHAKSGVSYQEILLKTDHPETAITAAKKYDGFQTYVKLDSQPSYVNVSNSLDPIRSVSYIFPLIFFFVAAIVVFISLSKTVENQRTQIAVMQALGISKSRIRLTFLTYATLSSLCGAIPFALFGNLLIPKLMIRVFMSRFALPHPLVPIYWLYILLPLLFALSFSGFATLIAVHKVLREIPAQAMRPRPPKGTKTILIERIAFLWKRLGYSGKLILRNIFLNKGRILLSSVGVIGSVMLIFTGLSLRNSATQVINQATGNIGYDLSVNYKTSITDEAELLKDFPVDYSEISETRKATLKLSQDVDINLQLVESSSTMVKLSDQHDQPIIFNESSVVLPDSVAEEYGLSVGDPLQITVEDKSYILTISDLSTQYTSKTLYLSFESAATAGMDTSAHTLLLTLSPGENTLTASDTLSRMENVKSVNARDDIISRSRDMLKTLNATILIILVSAAVLGMTVIYNITSINIFERTREYATLMVLGYYKREVYRLVLTENMVLTAFGSILGLPAGYYLFAYLTRMISQSNLRIPSQLSWGMVAATLLLTFVFALATNLLLRPNIRKIILVEALKGVE